MEKPPTPVRKAIPATYAEAVRFGKVEKWLEESYSDPSAKPTVASFAEPTPPETKRSINRHRVSTIFMKNVYLSGAPSELIM